MRPATTEEQPTSLDVERQELLGMRKLLDAGQFPKNQLVDLTQQEFPPVPEEAARVLPSVAVESSSSDGMVAGQTAAEIFQTADPVTESPAEVPAVAASEPPTFGPVRSRVRGKTSPFEMPTRPAQFRAEDLSEMLGEVIPRLLTDQSAPEEGETLDSPREPVQTGR